MNAPRRALTLFEVLVVLALLVAMGALVWPALIDRVAERRFDTALDLAREQLLLARAHAQATGEPIEVRLELEPPRLTARVFTPAAGADEDLIGAAFDDASFVDPEDPTLILESWARLPMPIGVTARRAAPTPDDEALLDEPLEPAPIDDRPIRLAVFLPDGSTLLAEEAWLVAEDGSTARISVGAWTGLAEIVSGP